MMQKEWELQVSKVHEIQGDRKRVLLVELCPCPYSLSKASSFIITASISLGRCKTTFECIVGEDTTTL